MRTMIHHCLTFYISSRYDSKRHETRLIHLGSVQYHTAIVQHLMPITQSGFFHGADLETFRSLIVSHAWKGLELLQLSQHIFTSRFSLPLISFCTLYLGDALFVHSSHLRNGPPNKRSSQVVRTCLGLLQQTRPGFPLCGPLQKLLCDRAVELQVPIPDDMGEILGSFAHYGVDSILDACSGLSFVQPSERLLPRIHPQIAKEWPAAWRESQTDRAVRIASLLNND